MSGRWIGADPGASGALALLCGSDMLSSVEEVVDMPYHEIDGKKRLDFWRLAAIIGAWTSLHTINGATVERVNAMPDQGVVSSFNFGGCFYAIQQALASASVPITLVSPVTWKAIYGLRGGRENKDMSRQKASQFYPASAHLWARKKDDGRAEAVLLARYGSQLRTA